MAHANRHHCILSLRSDARTRHQRRYRSHRPVLLRSLWSSASYHFWRSAQRLLASRTAWHRHGLGGVAGIFRPYLGPGMRGVHNGISVPWLEMDYVGRCHYRTGVYTPLCVPLPRDVSPCDPTSQSTGSAKEEWESEYQDCIG